MDAGNAHSRYHLRGLREIAEAQASIQKLRRAPS
jgi:hypothetical protein